MVQNRNNSQSSRIDLILTSVPVNSLKMDNLHTIFYHTFLSVTLSPAKTTHIPPMKDYVIGSDEILVRAIYTMQEFVALTSRPKHPTNDEDQAPNDDTVPNVPLMKTGPSTITIQIRRHTTPSTSSSRNSTLSMMKSQRGRKMKTISKSGTNQTP